MSPRVMRPPGARTAPTDPPASGARAKGGAPVRGGASRAGARLFAFIFKKDARGGRVAGEPRLRQQQRVEQVVLDRYALARERERRRDQVEDDRSEEHTSELQSPY